MLINFCVSSLLLFLLLLVFGAAVVVTSQCLGYRISPGLVARGDVSECFEVLILVLHGVGTLTEGSNELSQFKWALLQLQFTVGGQHELASLADGSRRVA